MKQKTQFQSENIMMSVVGHLLLVVLLISSFSVVVKRAKLVTPNRIEIIEIDLKNKYQALCLIFLYFFNMFFHNL